MIDWIKNNQRPIIGIGLIYLAAAYVTDIPLVWEIDGVGIIGTAAVVAAGVGYVAADKIEAMLPEEEGIYLVCFQASDDTGGEIWELSEDKFDAADVVAGSLFEWPVGKRVYECKEYNPEKNTIVGNWRESVASSQLAGNFDVADVYDDIREIRTDLEPEAMRARRLQRNIRSILRDLDRRRMKNQQEILDPTTNPTFGNQEDTVSAVIEEHMPDDLLPESMKGEKIDSDTNGQSDTLGFELLDDSEALNPEQ